VPPNAAEPLEPAESGPDTTGDGSPPRRSKPSRRDQVIVIGLIAAVAVFALTRGAVTVAIIVFLAVLVPSVILHEVSHGAVALVFGDDTAKRAGRLTLNPLRHIDPVGTLILPAILIVATGVGFGYAKPVPVNPARMRDPRNHSLLVSLAGPAVNIVLAVVAALAAKSLLSPFEIAYGLDPRVSSSLTAQVLISMGWLNAILAVFNLIPLPPLDGSAVVERLLPIRLWPAYAKIRPYSMLLILGIVLVFPGGLTFLFGPAIGAWEALAL
jgi:Zn-dependent protease